MLRLTYLLESELRSPFELEKRWRSKSERSAVRVGVGV